VNELRAQDVLDYWFGTDPLAKANFPGRLQLWFGNDDPPDLIAERDAALTTRFAPLIDAAGAGELDRWTGSPHRLLALILLLDQFPRHAFRGRALAYARDPKAQALALEGLQTGADAALSIAERLFFYLPLQHAESAEIQEESIAAYRRLVADAPAAQRAFFEDSLEFAQQHHHIIQRFGRFPHRNAVLSRRSTPEESSWLLTGQGP
jgi:uncharacterized protein (DUF924 family)